MASAMKSQREMQNEMLNVAPAPPEMLMAEEAKRASAIKLSNSQAMQVAPALLANIALFPDIPGRFGLKNLTAGQMKDIHVMEGGNGSFYSFATEHKNNVITLAIMPGSTMLSVSNKEGNVDFLAQQTGKGITYFNPQK